MNRSKLYENRGQTFNTNQLRHLSGSFAESYERSINENSALPFLKVYSVNGSVIEKTFAQFHLDVSIVRQNLLNKFQSAEVIVTVDGNTYENLVVMTAALLSGIPLSPMNPSEGRERIEQKIGQLGLESAIFVGSAYGHLSPTNSHELNLGQLGVGMINRKVESRQRSPDQPFIYIFTSGSTGYSKIVQQTEEGLLSNIDALIELHDFHLRKIVLATPLPVFHVNAFEFSFLASLLSGQRLILYPGFELFNILRSLEIDQVEVISVVPHILNSLCELSGKVNKTAKHLRYAVTAASSLAPTLAKKLTENFSFKIIQGYGLSEAINFSCLLPPQMSKAEIDHWLTNFERPSIGCAVNHNEVFILDGEGRPLPEGELGEVCIRGFNVMLGYKGSDNQDVFDHDFLHTGDLGFFKTCPKTKRSFFFITGRKKDVIKRFAMTVSLVEIDDLIAKANIPGLQAIAVSFAHSIAGEELAVVVSSPLSDLDQMGTLKSFLETLPSHMRPRVIRHTTDPIRNPSGKPQRWKFQDLFERYKDQIMGDEIILAV